MPERAVGILAEHGVSNAKFEVGSSFGGSDRIGFAHAVTDNNVAQHDANENSECALSCGFVVHSNNLTVAAEESITPIHPSNQQEG